MSRSPFVFSCDNKRYHTLNYYNRKRFGHKIYKAVIDCGLTCPNIDGSKGSGGCIFCDGGSGYFTHSYAGISGQLIRMRTYRVSSYLKEKEYVKSTEIVLNLSRIFRQIQIHTLPLIR